MTRDAKASTFIRGFLTLFIGSLIGKVAGLLREIIFAAAFGSGLIATGFKTAQSAVLVSANLVTGDMLSSAFVPTYAKVRAADPERARHLLWAYLLAYGIGMSAIAAALFGIRHVAMDFLVPGAALPVRRLAGDFLGTLAWCIPLFGVASVAGYALAADGRYTATSLRATLQTAGLLAGTVVAVLLGSPAWLAAGFVLAWVAYVVWCLLLLRRFSLLGRFHAAEALLALRVVGGNLVTVLPLAVIPAGVQVAIVAQRVIASHGPPALIASVDYAQTLSDSLVTLVSVPLGFVGLTQLSTLREEQFRVMSRRILSTVMCLGLPLTFLVLPLTGTIVQVVYRRGNFGGEAFRLTTEVAFGLFCGLTVQILGYALTRALSARQRNRAVLWLTVSAITAQIAVQSLSIPLGSPVFIGLGVTVYGLVLTVLAARLLGIHAPLIALALAGLPASAIGIAVLLVPGFPPFLQAAVASTAWAATIALAPPYRAVIADVRSIIVRRRRTPYPATEPLLTVSPAEQ